jgi:hypothetical protein
MCGEVWAVRFDSAWKQEYHFGVKNISHGRDLPARRSQKKFGFEAL